ncbi:hypothetical protein [Sorangium sp. So ce1078]|uniref:hypothetical protein n=1 Tax=Sorangium sp. So ce1078 TaxID=3133329 RepID=UPI003F5EC824
MFGLAPPQPGLLRSFYAIAQALRSTACRTSRWGTACLSASFYVDGSAAAGYAFQLAARVDDLPGGSSAQFYEPADESNVYATAALDLGLRF